MKITFFVIIFSVHAAFPLLFSDSMESLLNGNPWKSVQTRSEAEPSINEILAFLQVFKVVAQENQVTFILDQIQYLARIDKGNFRV